MVTKEREYRFEFPLELLLPAQTAAGWDESEHPRHPSGQPEGGRFAPKGEELFDPTTPEKVNQLEGQIYDVAEAWDRWMTQARIDGKGALKPGMRTGGDDRDAILAKIAVQDRIAAKLEGDEDFKSLYAALDPHGDWASSFEPTGEMSTATTTEKQVAALAIKNWSISSSDSDMIALQFQLAAEQEFGLTPNPYVHEQLAQAEAHTAEYGGPGYHDPQVFNEQQMRGARKFLRAQYDLTQEMFAQEGITHVYAYRGMGWGTPSDMPQEARILRQRGRSEYENASDDYNAQINEHAMGRGPAPGTPPKLRDYAGQGVIAIHGNALSSWSNDYNAADMFAGGGYYHAIVGTQIDVRRILSTPFSGFGALKESEYVVLGDEDMDGFTWVWDSEMWSPDNTDFNAEWVRSSKGLQPDREAFVEKKIRDDLAERDPVP